jgi:hypothetical protein
MNQTADLDDVAQLRQRARESIAEYRRSVERENAARARCFLGALLIGAALWVGIIYGVAHIWPF